MDMCFRSWLEMAMDFSDVKDPFDPEFRVVALKKKKLALVYHGTSTKWFWPIVRDGFTFDQSRKNWDKVTDGAYFSFDASRTNYYSFKASSNHGGEPLVFVAEIPFAMLDIDPDDSAGFDAEAKLQAYSKTPVPAKHITGVIYPVNNKPFGRLNNETPIRAFMQKVNRGKVDGIPPEEEQGTMRAGKKRRFAKATMDDTEHQLLAMLQDVASYTDLAHWVSDDVYLFNQKVLQALFGLERHEYMNWRGKDWVKFLGRVFGEDPGNDYDHYINSDFNYRTYDLIRKHVDVGGFYRTRLNREPPKPK